MPWAACEAAGAVCDIKRRLTKQIPIFCIAFHRHPQLCSILESLTFMATGVPQVLVAGLGNYTYPLSRHRYLISRISRSFQNTRTLIHFLSIGHIIVNSLAARLGIQLAGTTNGVSGKGSVTIGRTKLTLHLYKSSMQYL